MGMNYRSYVVAVMTMVPVACRPGTPEQSIRSVSGGGNMVITLIEPIFVRRNLSFSAAWAFGGTAPPIPDVVQISFATGKRGGYDFEHNRPLTFLLDQQTTLFLGLMDYDRENNMVRLFIPRTTFDSIVGAKTISGHVGDSTFVLDAWAQRALRALQASMPR